ncbi:FAD dependent oxidoreductase [Lactarius pseudohatsudake]|nr:FAD dependent oxidoreductase [Lactarius pseudohatsudake]
MTRSELQATLAHSQSETMTTTADAPVNNVLIIGAGIIGVSAAYHLSRLSPGLTIHLLDSSPSLFASASGKAAGFLARDWFPPATASLGALSFDLHRRLAEEHDGSRLWGYSPSTGFSLPEARRAPGGKKGEDWLFEGVSRSTSAAADAGSSSTAVLPLWLSAGREGASPPADILSSGATTAQVDPLQLCQFLLGQCLSRNVHVHHPVFVTDVITSSDNNTITGLSVSSPAGGPTTVLPCDALILTAGVWTPRVFEALFPNATVSLPITHLSGHSVVLRSPRWTAPEPGVSVTTACHAIFTTDDDACFSPEIFSRAGGDIYLAGLNTTAVPVPDLASEVQPDSASIEVLMRTARKLLGDDEVDVLRTGFCHRPVSRSGPPLLTRLMAQQTGVGLHGGVWVSAGHGAWGISMSLGTGLVLAELILRHGPSADVSQLGLHA